MVNRFICDFWIKRIVLQIEMILLGLVYVAIYLFVLSAKTKLSKLIILANTYFGTSGANEFRRLEGKVPPGRTVELVFTYLISWSRIQTQCIFYYVLYVHIRR